MENRILLFWKSTGENGGDKGVFGIFKLKLNIYEKR